MGPLTFHGYGCNFVLLRTLLGAWLGAWLIKAVIASYRFAVL
jgi:hypothetical protein